MTDFKQIQVTASSRGVVDYFFYFVCDEYKWVKAQTMGTYLQLPLISMPPIKANKTDTPLPINPTNMTTRS